MEEMASVLRCDATTIGRRFRGEVERGQSEMKVGLRRKQFELAMQGNVTLLIFLGKALLGQSDKGRGESPGEVDRGILASLSQLSVEEQNERLRELFTKAGFHFEATSGRTERSPTPNGHPAQAEP